MPNRPNIHLHGYVTNVAEMMTASDVVVTKAGSVTLAECFMRGRPAIIHSIIPGQEDGNIDYVTRHGAGWQSEKRVMGDPKGFLTLRRATPERPRVRIGPLDIDAQRATEVGPAP